MSYIKEGNDDVTVALKKVFNECSDYFDEVSGVKTKPFVYRGVSDLPKTRIEKRMPRADRAPRDSSILLHNIMDQMLEDKFGWKPRSTGVFTAAGKTAGNYGKLFIFVPSNGYEYIWCTKTGYDDMFRLFNHDEYKPDYYEDRGISKTGAWWVSTDVPEFFDGVDALYRHIDKLKDYTLYVDDLKKRVWKHNKTNKKITFDYILNGSGNNSEEAINKSIAAIKDKGDDYIKYCIDTNLETAVKTRSKAEIMFKCKYYYLIDMKLSDKLEGIIK